VDGTDKWATLLENQRRLGVIAGTKWTFLSSLSYRGLAPAVSSIRPVALRHRVQVRTQSSDMDLFRSLFVEGALGNCRHLLAEVPKTILDLGANVGYVSALLLNLFPEAALVAVEPDPANAQICRRNLAPYQERAKVVEGAAWHSRARLKLSRGTFGDGREWATQVREASSGEPADVVAWDIPSLLEMFGSRQIDLLKIDIEGSELALFSTNTSAWLPLVRNIFLEIHDDPADRVVRSALNAYHFQEARVREYSLFLSTSKATGVTVRS
jgi:FkbM family methyltransferase